MAQPDPRLAEIVSSLKKVPSLFGPKQLSEDQQKALDTLIQHVNSGTEHRLNEARQAEADDFILSSTMELADQALTRERKCALRRVGWQ